MENNLSIYLFRYLPGFFLCMDLNLSICLAHTNVRSYVCMYVCMYVCITLNLSTFILCISKSLFTIYLSIYLSVYLSQCSLSLSLSLSVCPSLYIYKSNHIKLKIYAVDLFIVAKSCVVQVSPFGWADNRRMQHHWTTTSRKSTPHSLNL